MTTYRFRQMDDEEAQDAIEVYERAGFRRGAVYMHHTNGADFRFLAMAREA